MLGAGAGIGTHDVAQDSFRQGSSMAILGVTLVLDSEGRLHLGVRIWVLGVTMWVLGVTMWVLGVSMVVLGVTAHVPAACLSLCLHWPASTCTLASRRDQSRRGVLDGNYRCHFSLAL